MLTAVPETSNDAGVVWVGLSGGRDHFVRVGVASVCADLSDTVGARDR